MPEVSTGPDASQAPESFEAALAELETIVRDMEAGSLTLEQSLAAYQRGTQLLKFCQGQLAAAEQKIQILEAGELAQFNAGEATQ